MNYIGVNTLIVCETKGQLDDIFNIFSNIFSWERIMKGKDYFRLTEESGQRVIGILESHQARGYRYRNLLYFGKNKEFYNDWLLTGLRRW